MSDTLARGHLVVLVGVALALTAPLDIGNDGAHRFTSLDALLRGGALDDSKYSIYGPLAAAPLWYLGQALGRPVEAVWLFNRVVFVAMLAGLWRALREIVPNEERVRFAALLCFGGMFPWHVTGFFAEVFHVACVGLGLALFAARSRGLLGAVLCAWGTANVPATAVGLVLASCVLCWHRRRLRYLALPAAAAALVLAENAIRRGDPLAGGYAGDVGNQTVLPYSGRPGFSYPLFFGLLSVLLSFGKGLVFFTPGLFVPYPESETADDRARLVYRVWGAVVVGLVLVYARWWAWYGGAVWGPRFFLFASLPAALVLARYTARAAEFSTRANVFVLLAVALACWGGFSGMVFAERAAEPLWANDFALEYLNWYVPEFSVLWLPLVVSQPVEGPNRLRLAAFALGSAYLAWPVVRVLAVRLRHGTAAAWRDLRSGPRWRV